MSPSLSRTGPSVDSAIKSSLLPVCMSGIDMIGIAKTGSSKTLAFLLPLFRHIADPGSPGGGGRAYRHHHDSHKGAGISKQIAELRRGAEIIMCMPGRMIDMVAPNSSKVTNLRRITYIVLDEPDRMFDMGFEPQIMRVMDHCRQNSHVLCHLPQSDGGACQEDLAKALGGAGVCGWEERS